MSIKLESKITWEGGDGKESRKILLGGSIAVFL